MLIACAMATCLAAGGCMSKFIDNVTSRDFRMKDLVSSPDPMTVLRQSQDGDARAKAMRELKEPIKNGRSPDEQDEAFKILAQSATSDSRPLCRFAAVDALGRFEDRRCVDSLIHAYHQADAMESVVANAIRSEVMAALAKKDSAEAIGLLAKVAGNHAAESPKSDVRQAGFSSEAGPGDHVTDRDLRLAAIHALGQSKDPAATKVLLPLLKEKDVAIRNRAHEALQAITGRKELPVDFVVWEKVLGGSKLDRMPRDEDFRPNKPRISSPDS
jgi:hypothetical protein